MPPRFDGQVVLITGASSGIGAALAREFARDGANTVLLARRVDRIEELARELTGNGHRSLAIAGDVTKDGDLEHAVEIARREFGRLDVAVANAGVLVRGRIETLTLDDYRTQFETNVLGVLRTIMAAIPAVKETHGRIIIIGSLLGMVSIPGGTPYSMSKFALNGLSDGLSHEMAPYGVSVTEVLSGYVNTEIYAKVTMRRKPRNWMKLTPEELARRVAAGAWQRKRTVILPWPTKIAILLQRHVPWLVFAAIQRAFRKATAAREREAAENAKPPA